MIKANDFILSFRKRENYLTILCGISYAIVLDLTLRLIAKVFDYEGYIYINDPAKVLLSYSMIVFLYFVSLQLILQRVSQLFSIVILYMLIVPAIVLFMRSDNVPYWHVILICGAYIWLLILGKIFDRIPLRIPVGGNRIIFIAMIATLSILTYTPLIYSHGIFFNINFSIVYDIREHFFKDRNAILGYLIIWQGNVINPLLFYQSMERKHFIYAFAIIGLQFYLFSITGLKFLFFSILFAYLVARYARKIYIYLPVALSLTIILSDFIYYLVNNVWFISFFARRTLFTASQVMYHYLEFFQTLPFVMLSDSILKNILAYPYLLSPPLLVGIRYYDGASANTGIIGNAYMHFGIAGVIVFIAIFAGLLAVLDRIIKIKPARSGLIIASVASTMISIINSGLFTVMLTHGLLLSILLAILMPSSDSKAESGL